VTGLVKRANGAPYSGVAVGVWSDAWVGHVSVSEPNGKYELPLSGLPPGTFRVAVVKQDTCSQQDGRTTASNCVVLSNIIENVTTTENCEGDGANQVTEIDFVGP
jgi:hypothetical protein